MEKRMFMRKVCMLGDFAVGKTNLASRFSQNVFNERYLTTMGARVSKKQMTVKDCSVTFMVWDLIGFLRYEKLIQTYVKGSNAGIIVFDVTRIETFKEVEKWADIFLVDDKTREVVLIGNKVDLGPKFDAVGLGQELATRRGWRFFLTSAKMGTNVDEAFKSLSGVE